jgi:hypothetical protein
LTFPQLEGGLWPRDFHNRETPPGSGDKPNTSAAEDLVTEIQTLVTHEGEPSSLVDGIMLESLLIGSAIPQLEQFDVVEYDSRSGSVRYHQQPLIEEYAEHAASQELSADFVQESL